MTGPVAPRLDPRRKDEFAAELQRRARAWIPSWDLANADGDFGHALLDIAARFSAEVAERLDGAGEKMRRGFLDWLAVRGAAARPARVPVVFTLADSARTGVLAEAPIRLQAPAGTASVVFETETDVRIVPGRLEMIVAADGDAYYLAPQSLSNLDPLDSTPTRWQPKSFTAAGATALQLDPDSGLAVDDYIGAGDYEYRVTKVAKDIVTIEPPLDADLSASDIVSRIDRFAPFDPAMRNWQKHELYLGATDLLNVEAAATIEVVGARALADGFTWEYYGKVAPREEVGWQALSLGTPTEQATAKGVVLHKQKGSVDVYEVNGTSSRWIRARLAGSSETFTTDQLALRINASECASPPYPADPASPSVAAEGMANTTPLVLTTMFFPLGKEPRQFDAFYLGSEEAFSKPGASAHLCFRMADPRFKALTALHGGSVVDNLVLAGVAADGYLHLLVQDTPGHLTRYGNPRRPPSPDGNGSPVADPPVPLDAPLAFRPAFWADGLSLAIAVSAGQAVWLWVENATPTLSGWMSLGVIDAAAPSSAKVQGLVYLADGGRGSLFVLLDKALYVRDFNVSNGAWQPVATRQGAADVSLQQIAPIASQANGMGGQTAEGLIAVADDGRVFAVSASGACRKLLDDADPTIAPAAVRRTDTRLVAVAVGRPGARELHGFLSNLGALTQDHTEDAELDWPAIVGNSIDVNVTGGQLTFACGVANGADRAVATWAPFATSAAAPLFEVSVPSSAGVIDGAPTLLPSSILVPTAGSEVIIASYDPSKRTTFIAPEGAAVVTSSDADRLLPGDWVAYHAAAAAPRYHAGTIPDAGVAVGDQRYHAFDTGADQDDLVVFKSTLTPFTGDTDTTNAPPDLTLLTVDVSDNDTQNGTVLLITTDKNTAAYEVTGFAAGVATLDRPLEVLTAATPPTAVAYQTPDLSGAALLPTLRLNATSNAWDQSLLERTRLLFEGGDPQLQSGIVLPPGAAPPPVLVVLGQFWTTDPPQLPLGVKFTVDAALGEWSRQLGDTSSNPELSWEYWNGTGWWTLGSVRDDTRNLKASGRVSFTVPVDLKPTDWSGQTNHWIRARLIGGDYGQETITVVTTATSSTTSAQTVRRSTDGIRAPSVLNLHISYGLCKPAVPTFVLAADSGSTRDQSDANRTSGAVVQAFVPLPALLNRLSPPAPMTVSPHDSCASESACGGQTTTESRAPASAAAPSTATSVSTAGAGDPAGTASRQILVGVSATLSEAPVNILLLVEERNHAALAPLVVEALNGDRFQPLVVDDATRALGESGVLSMSFAVQPAPRELFGRTLSWLRLTPKRGASGAWAPVIRGAYLNAVFASATETLTRELLGSSAGAPNLTLTVSRPPVLHDTMELRVREPLGDEELEQLNATDETVVLSDDPSLVGDWVRWTRVIDPADERPGSRVYALDEAIGELRFGDGLHGMIPPVGTDSIVAFSYQRTEPPVPGGEDVPANSIAARTPLNVVSPVESVESVIAADQAAGGAPPESDDRVLRFGFARLRHRNRAVTAGDLEDIALQSSPDIVQARCLTTPAGVRLVVVIKGSEPSPAAAQVRELRRLLLDAAPASMSAPGALTIVGPNVRVLRFDLTLRVEHLDLAGAVAREVKARLAAFFDTATGGPAGSGWPLGASPSEEDIALALLDVPALDSLLDVTTFEHVDGDADRPWPVTLKATELARLADDPLRIQFETAEVMA
ncbi:MAG: hypothetical protein ABI603_00435 [Acidobacteriota bacterium]